MNYAESLRKELADKNANIVATRFEPNRDKILKPIAEGIKRIGYVSIDTSGYDTSSYEGRIASSAAGWLKNSDLDAFANWLTKEGFRVTREWWGMSTNGLPDMLKIRL